MNVSDFVLDSPPWHAGERRLQARAGVADRMAQIGPKVVRDYMPDQHREFFAQLPFLVMGTVDEQGDPWAGVLEGLPGFAVSPDARTLTWRPCRMPTIPCLPAWARTRLSACWESNCIPGAATA